MSSEQTSQGEEGEYQITLGARDELVRLLSAFAKENGIAQCQLTARGNFSSVKLLKGNPKAGEQEEILLSVDNSEIPAIGGSLAFKDEKPHVHTVIAGAKGVAQRGHLTEAQVEGLAEAAVITVSGYDRPRFDDEPNLLPIT